MKNIDGIPFVKTGRQFRDPEEPFFTDWILFRAEDVKGISDYELINRIDFIRRYSGPGQLFTHRGSVYRVGKRVLAVQYGGLDI